MSLVREPSCKRRRKNSIGDSIDSIDDSIGIGIGIDDGIGSIGIGIGICDSIGNIGIGDSIDSIGIDNSIDSIGNIGIGDSIDSIGIGSIGICDSIDSIGNIGIDDSIGSIGIDSIGIGIGMDDSIGMDIGIGDSIGEGPSLLVAQESDDDDQDLLIQLETILQSANSTTLTVILQLRKSICDLLESISNDTQVTTDPKSIINALMEYMNRDYLPEEVFDRLQIVVIQILNIYLAYAVSSNGLKADRFLCFHVPTEECKPFIEFKSHSELTEQFDASKYTVTILKNDVLHLKSFSCFKLWRSSLLRRTIQRVVHQIENPSGFIQTNSGMLFNTCRGMGVPSDSFHGTYEEAKQLSEVFFLFMMHIICQNGEHLFQYMLKAVASMYVQRPGVLLKTALVFISNKQQVGKGVFLSILEKILGVSNTARVHKTDDFLGTFNKILEENYMLRFDECSQFTTKQQNSLKYLVTEDTIQIRAMRKDPYKATNHCNIVLTSNHSDALHLDHGNARFLLVPVSEFFGGLCTGEPILIPWLLGKHVKHTFPDEDFSDCDDDEPVTMTKSKFFELLTRKLNLSAVSYVLRQENLSAFVPTCIPRTTLNVDQIMDHLTCVQRFCMQLLETGRITANSRFALIEGTTATCPQPFVVQEFLQYGKNSKLPGIQEFQRISEKRVSEKFWREMRGLVPYMRHGQRRINGKQTWIVQFDSLEKCRDMFCKELSLPLSVFHDE